MSSVADGGLQRVELLAQSQQGVPFRGQELNVDLVTDVVLKPFPAQEGNGPLYARAALLRLPGDLASDLGDPRLDAGGRPCWSAPQLTNHPVGLLGCVLLELLSSGLEPPDELTIGEQSLELRRQQGELIAIGIARHERCDDDEQQNQATAQPAGRCPYRLQHVEVTAPSCAGGLHRSAIRPARRIGLSVLAAIEGECNP